jgi:uncharacterized protein YdaU (DUF1376 family)
MRGDKIMGESPFIKFYPSDFLAGTSGLSPAERGVYITLLCLIYENDGPIPRDDGRLSRRCGSPKAAFVRVLDGLMAEGKIVEVDGMLTNRRAQKSLIDRANRTQNSTHAAKQRWSAQAEKVQQNQSCDDAGAMPPQCVADASQKPEPEYTEAKASDGEAVDFAKALFDRGVKFLCQHGVKEQQARSLIGKWRQIAGDKEVFDAFAACNKAGATDPVSWIAARIKPPDKPAESVADMMQDILKEMTDGSK